MVAVIFMVVGQTAVLCGLMLAWAPLIRAGDTLDTSTIFKDYDASPTLSALRKAMDAARQCTWVTGAGEWEDKRDERLKLYAEVLSRLAKKADPSLKLKMKALSVDVDRAKRDGPQYVTALQTEYRKLQGEFDAQRPWELTMEEIIYEMRFDLRRNFEDPTSKARAAVVLNGCLKDEIVLTYFFSFYQSTSDDAHTEFRKTYEAWDRVVTTALANGRSLLIFVDADYRIKMGKSAHLEASFLRPKLETNRLVAYILSQSSLLIDFAKERQIQVEIDNVSDESQATWLRILDLWIKEAGPASNAKAE